MVNRILEKIFFLKIATIIKPFIWKDLIHLHIYGNYIYNFNDLLFSFKALQTTHNTCEWNKYFPLNTNINNCVNIRQTTEGSSLGVTYIWTQTYLVLQWCYWVHDGNIQQTLWPLGCSYKNQILKFNSIPLHIRNIPTVRNIWNFSFKAFYYTQLFSAYFSLFLSPSTRLSSLFQCCYYFFAQFFPLFS